MADFAALDVGQGQHARKVGLPQPALNPQTPERRTQATLRRLTLVVELTLVVGAPS